MTTTLEVLQARTLLNTERMRHGIDWDSYSTLMLSCDIIESGITPTMEGSHNDHGNKASSGKVSAYASRHASVRRFRGRP